MYKQHPFWAGESFLIITHVYKYFRIPIPEFTEVLRLWFSA